MGSRGRIFQLGLYYKALGTEGKWARKGSLGAGIPGWRLCDSYFLVSIAVDM